MATTRAPAPRVSTEGEMGHPEAVPHLRDAAQRIKEQGFRPDARPWMIFGNASSGTTITQRLVFSHPLCNGRSEWIPRRNRVAVAQGVDARGVIGTWDETVQVWLEHAQSSLLAGQEGLDQLLADEGETPNNGWGDVLIQPPSATGQADKRPSQFLIPEQMPRLWGNKILFDHIVYPHGHSCVRQRDSNGHRPPSCEGECPWVWSFDEVATMPEHFNVVIVTRRFSDWWRSWDKRHGLGNVPVEQARRDWLRFHDLAHAMRETDPTGVLLLQYEHLVASPEREMNRVYDFLGLPAFPVWEQVQVGPDKARENVWA